LDYFLKFDASVNEKLIRFPEKVMLVGSCFTEHIGNFLLENKMEVLQNPNGILFDTFSVCRSLNSYLENNPVAPETLFQNHEIWQHWQYHSQFSGLNKAIVLQKIRESLQQAAAFIRTTDWLIVTLGSSFAYRLLNKDTAGFMANGFVSNCHKAPQQWFEKYLIPVDEQLTALQNLMHHLQTANPNIKVILTISPVRHIRDGVVENNHSKARLIEVVHELMKTRKQVYYFPAYELVIDILRDYRFYDTDLVHPNYMATGFVIEQFKKTFIAPEAQIIMEKIKPVLAAMKHKPFYPNSVAHKKFLLQHEHLVRDLKNEYPFLDFEKELRYFTERTA
jgi:hypothetical protein